MEKDVLLTAKEEQMEEVKKQGIISLIEILVVLVATIVIGGEIWYKSPGLMLFAVVMFSACFALRPLMVLSSMQRARKERKKITENGRCVNAKIINISEVVGFNIVKMYCVQAVYFDGLTVKKWSSSQYKKNPRNYIEVGQVYKLYILGKKSCLEAVEAKHKEQ